MSLIVPKPDNVRARGRVVESDLYNIALRVKQLDDRLLIVLDEHNEREPWVVMERCADGVERFVKRYAELDQRILEDLRYMLAVPFEERVRRLDAENAKANDAHGRMDEETFERFAWEFMDAAKKSNLADPHWSRSYRKVKR